MAGGLGGWAGLAGGWWLAGWWLAGWLLAAKVGKSVSTFVFIILFFMDVLYMFIDISYLLMNVLPTKPPPP